MLKITELGTYCGVFAQSKNSGGRETRHVRCDLTTIQVEKMLQAALSVGLLRARCYATVR
jgi:hypothetical protein